MAHLQAKMAHRQLAVAICLVLARPFEKERAVRFIQRGTLLGFEISCRIDSNVRK
jgi:hypothetical protein